MSESVAQSQVTKQSPKADSSPGLAVKKASAGNKQLDKILSDRSAASKKL